jgi:REP element-mobilizing transposase RayT
MALNPRIERSDAIYYITANGNGRDKLFLNEQDYRLFHDTLGEALTQFDVLLHCHCAMPDHYHLVVQTPAGNLSRFMAWLQNTFTIRHNRRHQRLGHLFRGRYKALWVSAEPRYLKDLIAYVHLAPLRKETANGIAYAGGYRELCRFAPSSHSRYAGISSGPVTRLSDQLLKHWHHDQAKARELYVQGIKDELTAGKLTLKGKIRGSLVLGGHDLYLKALDILKNQKTKSAMAWLEKQVSPQRQQRLNELLAAEKSEKIKIWLTTKFSGQTKTKLATQYGYKDASGIVQLVKRLEQRALTDQKLALILTQLRQTMEKGSVFIS